MQNSKTLTYLRTLSKRETSKFDEFINSTYHNKSKLLIELWKYLKAFSPKFKHDKLEKDLLIVHLYSTVNQNTTKRFNDLTVAFCKLFEQFLLLQNLNKNQNYQERLLINELGERRISKAFYKRIEKNKKQIEKKAIQDIQDYEQLLFLETANLFYYETSKFSTDNEILQNILEVNHNLYILRKLKYTFEAKHIELIVNTKFKIPASYLDIEVLKNFEENLLVNFYNLLILLIKDIKSGDEIFFRLKEVYQFNLEIIVKSIEAFNILNFLIGYTAIQINSGKLEFYNEMFDLIKLGIEQKILFENNYINKIYLKNICVTAAELGHKAWLEGFLMNEKSYLILEKKDRESVKSFCEIMLYYSKQEFDKVLIFLNSFQTDTVDLQFWYRTMELRCLYELKEQYDYFELIEARIDAFKRYCYRIDILNQGKIENNLNFIKSYLQLLNEYDITKKDKEKVIEELKTTATVCKLWLLKKIEAL